MNDTSWWNRDFTREPLHDDAIGMQTVEVIRVHHGVPTRAADQIVVETQIEIMVADRHAAGRPVASMQLAASPHRVEELVRGVLLRAWGYGPGHYHIRRAGEPAPHARTIEAEVEVKVEMGVPADRQVATARDAVAVPRTSPQDDAAGTHSTAPIHALAPLRNNTLAHDAVPIVHADTINAAAHHLETISALRAATGGVHVAAYHAGTFHTWVHDISRHNTLDRLLGRLVAARTFPWPGFLIVSSRITAELLERTFLFNCPIVASVAAPTNQAVTTADAVGITLIGFVRPGRLTIYTHPERIATDA